jgi:hypothetical protein
MRTLSKATLLLTLAVVVASAQRADWCSLAPRAMRDFAPSIRKPATKSSDGGGQLGEMFRPEHFAELTTPSAPLRWLRNFLLLGAATPPFQGGEK